MTENRSTSDSSTVSSGSDYLSELIRSVSAESQAEPQRSEGTESAKGAGADVLSSLLSNPELIAKLPSIIATVKPIIELLGSGALNGAASRPAPQKDAQPTFSQIPWGEDKAAPVSVSHSERKGGDRRADLLCALKPYLCEERRRAIDYVIKLDRLGDVLKSL